MSSELSSPRWGRSVIPGEVAGHACRVYKHRPRSLGELLLDAQRWGERELLVQGGRRLTMQQMTSAVAKLARQFRECGVRAGSSAVLFGYNGVEWLVAFWALQTIGATAILGNAWWGENEIAEKLGGLTPKLTVSGRSSDAIRCLGGEYVEFEHITRMIENPGVEELAVNAVDEESPAWVIFSSGTAGHAKGVVASHRAIVANVQNLLILTGRLPSELDPSRDGPVSLVTMPLFHLGGIQISILTMLTGGKLIFPAGRFDPVETLKLIERESVRSWGAVPTMVSRVIHHPAFASYDTSSVKSVQMGGAAVPSSLRAEVAAAFLGSKGRVGSLYGLTEAGGVLAAGSGVDLDGRPGCVGRPLPPVEIVIRNPDANNVGEIAARAPSAPSGYLDDPTPIADADGWVLTGDLGRFDEEGRLFIVGRSKDTIIRGGENVAAHHVEDVLRTHEAVLEVAVVPLANGDLGEEVGAAIVVRPGFQVDATALHSYASQRLAKFETPSRWQLRREPLPSNMTGKVSKRDIIAQWTDQAALEASK